MKERITKVKTKKLKGKKKKDINKHGEEGLGLKKDLPPRNDINQEVRTTIWMSNEEHLEFKIASMRLGIPLYEYLYMLIKKGEKRRKKEEKNK